MMESVLWASLIFSVTGSAVYVSFVREPHNLIGERTGGNKTFLSGNRTDFYS